MLKGALSGDPCTVNLDALTGKYPPLITQNDNFVFPTSREADESRLLTFGKKYFIVINATILTISFW